MNENTLLGTLADIQVSPSPEMKSYVKEILIWFAVISLALIVIRHVITKI
jgi:hypothetical protein